MEVVQLLEMSTNEGKNYGHRFFKFFYYDKFYLIDNLKVDVLFRILKIKTKNKDLTGKNTDYDAIQKEFLEAIAEKNILSEYSVLAPELLDLVSQFQSKPMISRKHK